MIRQPAVANLFYPSDPERLRALVDGYLQNPKTHDISPKALIAPHAGYIYSGSIAGNAYAYLSELRAKIKRVVLLGPAHRVAFSGLGLSSAESFATPLGTVPVDHTVDNDLHALPQVQINDQAHWMEHSLEVHLPFLQILFDAFKLIPIVVGDADKEEVAEVLESVWGGPETLIVISSDLSHYKNYEDAQAVDLQTTRAIEAMQADHISYDQACGRNPIRGLLHLAKRMNLKMRTVDVRNSGDTAGDKKRVVGYGAYVFYS